MPAGMEQCLQGCVVQDFFTPNVKVTEKDSVMSIVLLILKKILYRKKVLEYNQYTPRMNQYSE